MGASPPPPPGKGTIPPGGTRFEVGPWIVGALIWGLFSLVVLLEYLSQGDGVHLDQFWFLLSLIWFQFGFGSVFISLLRPPPRALIDRLLIALAPPLILYLFVLGAMAFHRLAG
ncbi:MAG: hypothetical protein HQL52_00855 [Magnetococcales bacterium]|nr:hypothetical protein [Magnetococcales bacterium]